MLKIFLTAFLFTFLSTAQIQAAKFEVAHDGHVFGTQMASTAAYDSNMYLIVLGSSSPSVAISNHGYPTTVDFGYFTKGQVITFALDVINTGDTFYSDIGLNPDGINHVRSGTWNLIGGHSSTFIGFEDLYGGGDLDFNDNVVWFGNVITSVPEPATWGCIMVGLLMLYARNKLNHASN